MNWLTTLPSGLHAVELTGRDRSAALSRFDDFADTELEADVEPTERDSWLAALGSEQ